MGKHRFKIWAIWVVAIGASGWFAWKLFGMPVIPPHRGDGEFKDLSRRAGPFPIRGYAVSMPEFDLGEPFQAQYRVRDLTNIGLKCGVHLAIKDPKGKWFFERTSGGWLKLKLVNAAGVVVVALDGGLNDYIWWGFGELHALYQMEKSWFQPNSREEYTINVSYSPSPDLAGYKGFVYVRSGGSK